MMNNFEKIKSMTLDEMADYIRSEYLEAMFRGVVLDKDSIKQWLQQESEG